MKQEDIYEVKEKRYARRVRYLFTSKGEKNVIKVVEYTYIEDLGKHLVFNFGFGDYNINNDEIIDDIISNNGDVYKVFNTVLSTVPCFFKVNSNAMIRVQGSDSDISYAENCRLICKKKCKDFCKNAHRRISIYSNYVNKNFSEITEQFILDGGYINVDGKEVIEKYDVNGKYISIYLMQKNN